MTPGNNRNEILVILIQKSLQGDNSAPSYDTFWHLERFSEKWHLKNGIKQWEIQPVSKVVIYKGILIIWPLEKNRSHTFLQYLLWKNRWKRTIRPRVMILVGFKLKYCTIWYPMVPYGTIFHVWIFHLSTVSILQFSIVSIVPFSIFHFPNLLSLCFHVFQVFNSKKLPINHLWWLLV